MMIVPLRENMRGIGKLEVDVRDEIGRIEDEYLWQRLISIYFLDVSWHFIALRCYGRMIKMFYRSPIVLS
jgi:hypothetical protein